ncbi:uncharacterized protein LOC113389156 isoform X1 [Ctenocephalides felis]|uniref:uncharacterized protein LOC113389156 isoform X1 n=1 Tax=Ctenocephalides felis TaxID=7515 RepID=UPI000E6E24DE|nr:uncharacterized protein LOC113389156 isoform X1 [Ctenocephalides felis]
MITRFTSPLLNHQLLSSTRPALSTLVNQTVSSYQVSIRLFTSPLLNHQLLSSTQPTSNSKLISSIYQAIHFSTTEPPTAIINPTGFKQFTSPLLNHQLLSSTRPALSTLVNQTVSSYQVSIRLFTSPLLNHQLLSSTQPASNNSLLHY